jgi:hypothetical protein
VRSEYEVAAFDDHEQRSPRLLLGLVEPPDLSHPSDLGS